MEQIAMKVNGKALEVKADPKTPLLYVLRNDLGEKAPKFGCGLAQCGACTVQLDGQAIRSCATPISSARGAQVRTLEGLGPKPGTLHAVQQAFIEEQAAQCGYCLNGWVMTAAALLDANPRVGDDEIRRALAGLKCRCGTHMAILRAVKLAAKRMAGEARA